MFELKQIKTQAAQHSYVVFGNGPVDLVMEIGLGATMGEWYHIAEHLADEYSVLLYERSRSTKRARTPENIAKELHLLLDSLGHAEKIVLVAHSQGGLYAQQFARLYPDMLGGILFLDPLSARDNAYKTVFTPEEQKKSGFNKSENLVIMEKLAKLHLGFIIRAVMKKAPPFYYYDGFSEAAKRYILSSISKPDIYASALEEYRLAHEEEYTRSLVDASGFPEIPVVLVTHTPDYSIRETMESGQTDRAFAQRVEDLWQSLMRDYLSLGSRSQHIQKKTVDIISICASRRLSTKSSASSAPQMATRTPIDLKTHRRTPYENCNCVPVHTPRQHEKAA